MDSLVSVPTQVHAAMAGNSKHVEHVKVGLVDRSLTQMISRAPDIVIETYYPATCNLMIITYMIFELRGYRSAAA